MISDTDRRLEEMAQAIYTREYTNAHGRVWMPWSCATPETRLIYRAKARKELLETKRLTVEPAPKYRIGDVVEWSHDEDGPFVVVSVSAFFSRPSCIHDGGKVLAVRRYEYAVSNGRGYRYIARELDLEPTDREMTL